MATVPTPYDATSGVKMQATAWDAGVRDPLTWALTNYPRCHAFISAGNNYVNNTATLATYASEIYDTDTMHDNTTNPSRITTNTAGLYEWDYLFTMPTASYSGSAAVNLRLNSAGSSAGGTSIWNRFFNCTATQTAHVQLIFKWFMNAGDYFEAFMLQTSGATQPPSFGSTLSRVQATWIATA